MDASWISATGFLPPPLRNCGLASVSNPSTFSPLTLDASRSDRRIVTALVASLAVQHVIMRQPRLLKRVFLGSPLVGASTMLISAMGRMTRSPGANCTGKPPSGVVVATTFGTARKSTFKSLSRLSDSPEGGATSGSCWFVTLRRSVVNSLHMRIDAASLGPGRYPRTRDTTVLMLSGVVRAETLPDMARTIAPRSTRSTGWTPPE